MERWAGVGRLSRHTYQQTWRVLKFIQPWEERTLNHIIYGTIYSKPNIIRDDFISRFTRDNMVGDYMKPSRPRHIYIRFGYDNHTTRKIQREIFATSRLSWTSRKFLAISRLKIYSIESDANTFCCYIQQHWRGLNHLKL